MQLKSFLCVSCLIPFFYPLNATPPSFATLTEKQIQIMKDFDAQPKLKGMHYFYGPDTKKRVALTFDDGPDATYTEQILNVLKNKKVSATFFLIGKNVEKFPAVAKKIIKEGHEVAGHTYDHPRIISTTPFAEVSKQLQITSSIIKKVCGVQPLLFRPPYGLLSCDQLARIGKSGMKSIFWSIDTDDWDALHNQPSRLIDVVTNNIHEGAIVLMHSGGGNRANTVTALPKIIDALQAKGYSFCKASELLDIKPYRMARK